MNRKFLLGILSIIIFTIPIFINSCNKMPVGYLNTENAKYEPDTVYAYRNIDVNSKRYINNAPWTSLMIQGVSGTNPIHYEFSSVKVDNGGSHSDFMKMVSEGHLVVRGGLIQLFQSGVKMIPNGSYIISIKVFNEGYNTILNDVITFIVEDNDPNNLI